MGFQGTIRDLGRVAALIWVWMSFTPGTGAVVSIWFILCSLSNMSDPTGYWNILTCLRDAALFFLLLFLSTCPSIHCTVHHSVAMKTWLIFYDGDILFN
jgi:hypothetical protein